MAEKKTHEQFVQEIYNCVKNEYSVIGQYINSRTKIEIKHNICGYNYPVLPSSFLRGARCPNCAGTAKKTHEQFLQEVQSLVGNEYIVLGHYKNNKTRIELKHSLCGYKYPAIPDSFLRGKRCPKCAGNIKKTHEQFLEEIKDLVSNEYSVLEDYNGNKTKIEFKHNPCGYKYCVTPSDFILKGSRCPNCAGKMRKTHEQFLEKVHDLVGDEYTVLEEYKNNKTQIKFKHNLCEHEYSVRPDGFLRGRARCPKCAGILKRTHEQFVQEVYELIGDEYIVLEDFRDSKTKIKFKHNVCGYKYPVTPYDFFSGKRCPKCAGNIKKTHEQFVREVHDITGNEYTVLGEYKNNKTLIKLKHNSCGYKYKVIPNAFLKGNRCPKCMESHGEMKIRTLLDNLCIEFKTQFKFAECKNKRPLPFDFVVFKGSEIVFLIEYDGAQHYKPIKHFGGEKSLKKLQKNDSIKENYCKINNIPLLRIPYWEFDNIESILTDFLKRRMDISA